MITYTIGITPKSKEEQTYIHHAMLSILESLKNDIESRWSGNKFDYQERIYVD